MINKDEEKYCIKLNDSIEKVQSILKKKGYENSKLYYILSIYMSNKPYRLASIKSIEEITNYAIIYDFNGNEKEIVFHEDGEYKGKITGVNSTKSLLDKLGFTELFHANKDIYEYRKENIKFDIIDVKDIGVFIDLHINDDVENQLNIIKKLGLHCNKKKINVNIETECFKYKKGE